MELGHYVEMSEYLEKAIALDPTDPSTFYHRGEIFALSNNMDAAVADFSRAIQLDPVFIDAYVHLSRAYLAHDMIDVAHDFSLKALKLFPDEAEILHAYGECLAMEGDREQALKMFDKVEGMAPEFPQVALNKALIEFMNSASDEKLENDLRSVLQKFPSFDAAHVQLASHLMSKGKFDEALLHYDIAVKHSRSYQELLTICTLQAISESQVRAIKRFPDLAGEIQYKLYIVACWC